MGAVSKDYELWVNRVMNLGAPEGHSRLGPGRLSTSGPTLISAGQM